MHDDRVRFVDPWWLLLPEGGSAVIGVAGSGGRSTLLRRLATHYAERGTSVLWTQTEAQPAPVDWEPCGLEAHAVIDESLRGSGRAFVAGDLRDGLHSGLTGAQIELLRRRHGPDIVLVDCHARCERPLRRDRRAPVWPEPLHIALLVSSLAAVGRPYGPDSVAGVESLQRQADGMPRRIRSEDLLQSYLDPQFGLLASVPEAATPIPILTGFGSYRDMDGMFALVRELWSQPGLRAVCLAELLGDERRDQADLRDLLGQPEDGAPLSGERIYALYPAHLDED